MCFILFILLVDPVICTAYGFLCVGKQRKNRPSFVGGTIHKRGRFLPNAGGNIKNNQAEISFFDILKIHMKSRKSTRNPKKRNQKCPKKSLEIPRNPLYFSISISWISRSRWLRSCQGADLCLRQASWWHGRRNHHFSELKKSFFLLRSTVVPSFFCESPG